VDNPHALHEDKKFWKFSSIRVEEHAKYLPVIFTAYSLILKGCMRAGVLAGIYENKKKKETSEIHAPTGTRLLTFAYYLPIQGSINRVYLQGLPNSPSRRQLCPSALSKIAHRRLLSRLLVPCSLYRHKLSASCLSHQEAIICSTIGEVRTRWHVLERADDTPPRSKFPISKRLKTMLQIHSNDVFLRGAETGMGRSKGSTILRQENYKFMITVKFGTAKRSVDMLVTSSTNFWHFNGVSHSGAIK
jgi:hypothetical protein